MNRRILGIKPVSTIKRLPRTLNDRGFFKANELRCLLLYYLRYCSIGLLDTKYVQHFQSLSAGTYILSEETVCEENIIEARRLFTQFTDEFEILYGKQNVTMNLHLLRHIPNAVQNLGPFWSQSLFGFEAKNGDLVKFVKSKTNVLQQITSKYILSHTLSMVENGKSKKKSIELQYENKFSKLTPNEKKMFSEHGINDRSYRIWQRLVMNGRTYTSTTIKKSANGHGKAIH